MSWYKTSQKSKKPYNIYKLGYGQERLLKRISPVWAYSAEQARMFVLQKYQQLRDFLEACRECSVEARLDREKLDEMQRANKAEKELKEKQIEEAWWQD